MFFCNFKKKVSMLLSIYNFFTFVFLLLGCPFLLSISNLVAKNDDLPKSKRIKLFLIYSFWTIITAPFAVFASVGLLLVWWGDTSKWNET